MTIYQKISISAFYAVLAILFWWVAPHIVIILGACYLYALYFEWLDK